MFEHETQFAKSFVVREKRERYLELLTNPKKRKKITQRLNHHHALDLEYVCATKLAFGDTLRENLVALLQKKGAGGVAHIIADDSKTDGMDLPLEAALEFACIHHFAVIVSCIPGKLAIFKGEAPVDYYLFEKHE